MCMISWGVQNGMYVLSCRASSLYALKHILWARYTAYASLSYTSVAGDLRFCIAINHVGRYPDWGGSPALNTLLKDIVSAYGNLWLESQSNTHSPTRRPEPSSLSDLVAG